MKNYVKYISLSCGFVFLLLSCGPSRFVEPLQRGQRAISASLGGPMINVPDVAPIPLPMTSITYGQGILEGTTVYGSWFSTAAIFGTIQFDAGVTQRVWKNDKNMGISVSPGFNLATDVFEWNTKFWPQLDANFYWKYNVKMRSQDDVVRGHRHVPNLLYAGLGSWYELSGTRAHDEPQPTRILPNVQIGHDYNWSRWSFKTELKIIAPFSSNENIVTDYISILGDFGATGIYFGLTRNF